MCRDGHVEIGHNDSSSEMCPLCRAKNEIEELKDEILELSDQIDKLGDEVY